MTVVDRRPALIACAVPETFGAVLITRRTERGWTQRRLAEEVGVSRQTVIAWESGEREPRLTSRLALRAVFGLSETDDGGWWGRW